MFRRVFQELAFWAMAVWSWVLIHYLVGIIPEPWQTLVQGVGLIGFMIIVVCVVARLRR